MNLRLRSILIGAAVFFVLTPTVNAQNRSPARPKPQRPIEVPPAVVVLPIDTTPGDSTRTIIQRDFDYGDRIQPLVLDSATLEDMWRPGDSRITSRRSRKRARISSCAEGLLHRAFIWRFSTRRR